MTNCLTRRRFAAAFLIAAHAYAGVAGAANGTERTAPIELRRLPDGAIQPQAIADAAGNVHLIYYKGPEGAGDLFYVRQSRDGRSSEPIRVNSQPGSAIAAGTIRGGMLAVSPAGQVHVVWNGSGSARPLTPLGGTPVLYTRLNRSGTAFEPQRNLMRRSQGLDGGASIAAGQHGTVSVVWHGQPAVRDSRGEVGRRVWLAASHDGGATFGTEVAIDTPGTGACGCCQTRAWIDRQGALYVLYRAAGEGVHRDMMLLASHTGAAPFVSTRLHPWLLKYCPMSSEAFAETRHGVVAAWETAGQIFVSRIDPVTLRASAPSPLPGHDPDRKHPALTATPEGLIAAWTEKTGWQKGGDLVWQVLGRNDPGASGRVPGGIAVWSVPAVVTTAAGRPVLLY